MSEFDLINRYFKSFALARPDVVLGIGDDCALLQPPAGMQLAVSCDTLVSGVHFPLDTRAEDIGYKSLAVNLSDLAAMGAQPAWVMLALTLPEENETWLANFMQGFSSLAIKHGVQLIGGDTTHGPLSITIQIFGFVEPGQALRRDAAEPGDLIFVTGTLGDAALGLKKCMNQIIDSEVLTFCVNRLNRPTPRNEIGRALMGMSRCAIDVSDGLLADLGHITEQSRCGAQIHMHQLPLSHELRKFCGQDVDWASVVSGGDDYELCFTADPQYKDKILNLSEQYSVAITCIGEIVQGSGIKCLDDQGREVHFTQSGYNHFA